MTIILLEELWRTYSTACSGRFDGQPEWIGSIGCTVLVASKFAAGSLRVFWLAVALVLNLIFGFWPVVLQRYNRLRLYRAYRLKARLAVYGMGRRKARCSAESVAIHIAIHNNVVYDVLPMTCGAVRALLCR
jgi:hypothetical protein